MDQHEYIKAIQTMDTRDIGRRTPEQLCNPTQHSLFRSLLGAIAYAMMSQFWLAVYVVALQRVAASPKHKHCSALNKLVRVLKAQAATSIFPHMIQDFTPGSDIMHAFTDASFKKEVEDKGYGMRGSIYVLEGTSSGAGRQDLEGTSSGAGRHKVYHLLWAASKSLSLVTRSTYAAELLAAVCTADYAVPLMITLHELKYGPLSAHDAMEMRNNGGFAYKLILYVDAKSVYSSIISAFLKVPAEASLVAHLLWIRELLQKGILQTLTWVDTRDMLADAMTKGLPDRTPSLTS